jgi:hypothetical protein
VLPELQRRADRIFSNDDNDAGIGDNVFLAAFANVDRYKFADATSGALAADRRVFERLTRDGPAVIDYEITLDDATVWTQPWTARTRWKQTDKQMYEDACHEGNYSMTDILKGCPVARPALREPSTMQKAGPIGFPGLDYPAFCVRGSTCV